jgi:FAD binding domain
MNSIIAIVIALAFLFNSTSGKPVQYSASSQINSRQQSLSDCLSAHNVPTKLISSPDWSTFESPYNLRLVYVPAAITLPTTPQQVSDSVTCAAAAGAKVQAKSGGHSYASFSSGGQDGSLIVDLQEFNSISVDSTTFIAAVGGGVRLGNMALALYAQGQRALPHGTCPGVGIGGHFTHGGYGYDSRLWGLALDTIVAMDTVLANGTFVHVTSTSYPDLFFALRGAAESIGIVTTFYLKTLPAPSSVINFSVDLSAVLSSASTVANAFLELQNFVLTSPLVNRNISFGIYTSGSSFSLGGWYFGDQTYFTTTVLPAMLNGFPAATPSIQALGWIDSLVHENNGQPLSEPLSGYNAHDTFYAKSIVSHNAQPLTLAALESFWGYVINKGQSFPSWFSIINLYGGRDSQINVQPLAPSSYADRDALWVFQVCLLPIHINTFQPNSHCRTMALPITANLILMRPPLSLTI